MHEKEALAEYLGAIEAFKKGEPVTFNESVLPENINGGWANQITVTCKNYNMEGGLSKALHSARPDQD